MNQDEREIRRKGGSESHRHRGGGQIAFGGGDRCPQVFIDDKDFGESAVICRARNEKGAAACADGSPTPPCGWPR